MKKDAIFLENVLLERELKELTKILGGDCDNYSNGETSEMSIRRIEVRAQLRIIKIIKIKNKRNAKKHT